eukprot:GHVU01225532.1.p1 GENE.GHVU01225532.1~~GHVU01225532.1.p1  ORF type:complete len:285 (+),score=53.02 GHVU01225532.1:1670-2524(+)
MPFPLPPTLCCCSRVRCRSPNQVKEGLSHADMVKVEETFFKGHTIARKLPQECWGVPTLVKKIVQLQEETLNKWLPEVRLKIVAYLTDKNRELRTLPETCATIAEKRLQFYKLVQGLLSMYKDTLEGEYKYPDEKLHVPPRIDTIFRQFRKDIDDNTSIFMSASFAQRVERKDKENVGCALPNFLSSPIFNQLYVENFDAAVPQAVERLLQRTSGYVEEVLSTLFDREFREFPKLVGSTKVELRDLMEEQLAKATAVSKEIVDSLRWVNTFDEQAHKPEREIYI